MGRSGDIVILYLFGVTPPLLLAVLAWVTRTEWAAALSFAVLCCLFWELRPVKGLR